MKSFVLSFLIATALAEYSTVISEETPTCTEDPWGHTECAYNECCGYSYIIPADDARLDETDYGYEAAFEPGTVDNEKGSQVGSDGTSPAEHLAICLPTMTEKINDGTNLWGFACYMEISAVSLTLASASAASLLAIYA